MTNHLRCPTHRWPARVRRVPPRSFRRKHLSQGDRGDTHVLGKIPSRIEGFDDVRSFGWNIAGRQKKRLHFLDAPLSPDTVKAGAFDRTALLAGLEAKAREMDAKPIAFDALDVLLSLLDDRAAEQRELHRIQAWLKRTARTAIITAKVDENDPVLGRRGGFLAFMADCVVRRCQSVLEHAAVRKMRIVKYRGSIHVLPGVPFIIEPAGTEVGASNGNHPEPQPFKERVSTGIARLDEMLDGGVYRGTNALITGGAGTGKLTLSGRFVEAACRRGERALFVSCAENALDNVRGLAAVSVDLTPYLKSGPLRMEAVRIAVERLVSLCRNERITVLFTSLHEARDQESATLPLRVSSLVDPWMQIVLDIEQSELAGTRTEAHLDLPIADPVATADAPELQRTRWSPVKNTVKSFNRDSGVPGVGRNAADVSFMPVLSEHGTHVEPGLLPLVFGSLRQGADTMQHLCGGRRFGLSIANARRSTLTASNDAGGRSAPFRLNFKITPAATISRL